ncbi:MAG: hypothetical protein ABIK83_11430 [Candidatus Zixiibacteriota bacterium]
MSSIDVPYSPKFGTEAASDVYFGEAAVKYRTCLKYTLFAKYYLESSDGLCS